MCPGCNQKLPMKRNNQFVFNFYFCQYTLKTLFIIHTKTTNNLILQRNRNLGTIESHIPEMQVLRRMGLVLGHRICGRVGDDRAPRMVSFGH